MQFPALLLVATCGANLSKSTFTTKICAFHKRSQFHHKSHHQDCAADLTTKTSTNKTIKSTLLRDVHTEPRYEPDTHPYLHAAEPS